MIKIINKSYEVIFLMFVSITILVYVRSTQHNLSEKDRLSLQLAAFVTTIASMHYYLMITSNENIVQYRYFDWFFTTPILLIDLCLILDITELDFIIEIVGYNLFMLLFGYMGELNILSIFSSTVLGFIPFVILFYKIYEKVKKQNNTKEEKKRKINIISIFALLWSFYGINHLNLSNLYQNGIFNILDLITKGFFALFIFASSYHTTL